MPRSLHAKAGLGAALQIVQEGGLPLRRVWVDFPSLILVRAGQKRLRVQGVEVIANPGELLAVAAGCEIEVTNALPARGPYEASCLAFDPELSRPPATLTTTRAIAPAAALGRPPDFLLSAFQRATAACEQPADFPASLLRHQLHEVLLALELLGWRFHERDATPTSTRLRRLLASDPAQAWRIRAVGQRLGMSEATLRRRLEREGFSFRALLSQVRMSCALTLLQSSDLSVTQIAGEVGYDSTSQFTARFRRHFGQSPRQLRERRP